MSAVRSSSVVVFATAVIGLLLLTGAPVGSNQPHHLSAPRAVITRDALLPATPSVPALGGPPGSPGVVNTTVGTWQRHYTPASLQGMGQPLMTYDPQLGGILLFGGYSGYFNNAWAGTWLFKNNTWTNLNATGALPITPPGRWWGMMTYDPAGPYVVMFGGRNNSLNYYSSGVFDDTWIFNTTGWHQLFPAVSPSGRAWGEMFYDPVNQKVVEFSGTCYYCAAKNDTWFFSNGTWTDVTANVSTPPPAVNVSDAAWDDAVGAGVLADGGRLGTIGCPTLNQTWEFTTGWNQTSTLTPTPIVNGNSGTYDSYSSAFVEFAGNSGGCYALNSTWAFVNDRWVNLSAEVLPSSNGPVSRCCDSMAYDPVANEILTFGGNSWPFGAARDNDTWTLSLPRFIGLVNATPDVGGYPLHVGFNSTIYGGIAPYSYSWSFGDGSANATTENATHVYSRSGVYYAILLVTDSVGNNSTYVVPIIVTSPEGWHDAVAPNALAPSQRGYPAFAYDPQLQGDVLFGGQNVSSTAPLGDTWLYANGSWVNLNASGQLKLSPPARWLANMVWNPNGPYLVLFGGRSATQFYNDTWVFNASGWHMLSTPIAPSPRGATQMFFDPTVDRLVLFGGTFANLLRGIPFVGYDDTWYFGSGAWTNITGGLATSSPPPTTAAPTAWDPSIGAAVMASGQSAGGGCATYNTTWLYATGWNQTILSPNPGAVAVGPTAVFDPLDGYLLFYGGEDNGLCGTRGSTWSYENSSWSNLTPTLNRSDAYPPARFSSAMTYDDALGAAVLFGGVTTAGGNTSSGALNDTWTFPVAPFLAQSSATRTVGLAPLPVTFTSSIAGGIGPYESNWSFGDGSANSTTPSASHTFTNVGEYAVVFHATDAQGRSLNRTITIDVVSPLSAAISASQVAGEAPFEVNFTAPLAGGAGPYRYFWAFGDGQTSTSAAPSHIYRSAGVFTATVTVSDQLSEAANASVALQVVGSIGLSFSSAVVRGIGPFTAPLAVAISGGLGPFSLNWSFGDGSSATAPASTTHLYAAVGTYLVNVTVTDAYGRSATAFVTVEVAQPLVAFANATPLQGIAPLTVGFSGSAAGGFPSYSYTWQFGDDSLQVSGAGYLHTYSSPGTYVVNLTVTDSIGTIGNASIVVHVAGPLTTAIGGGAAAADAPVNLTFSALPDGGLAPYTFAWTFGDGGTSSTSSPTHRFASAGKFTVSVQVTDSVGDLAHASRSVTVSPALSISVRASPDPLTLNGTNVTVTAQVTGGSGGVAFTWSSVPWGCTPGNVSSFVCSPTSSGNFTVGVNASDVGGGHAAGVVVVDVQAAPENTHGPGGNATAGGGSFSTLELAAIVAIAVVVAAVVVVWRIRRRPPSVAEEPTGSEDPLGGEPADTAWEAPSTDDSPPPPG